MDVFLGQTKECRRVQRWEYLLYVLDGNLLLLKLLVDEDERVQVAHPAIQQLIWKFTFPLNNRLMKLHESEDIGTNRSQ